MLQADHFGSLLLLKVAGDCIPNLLVEHGQIIGLSVNGYAEDTRCVPAFGSFFHPKITSFIALTCQSNLQLTTSSP